MPSLTQAQIDAYWRDGFVVVEDVVPPQRLNALIQRIEALCDDWDSDAARRVGVQQEDEVGVAMTNRSQQTVRKFSYLSEHEPIFREQATDPDFARVVIELIGGPLLLYADQAFLKPPKLGSPKLPHQDNAHFEVTPDDAVITCWMALDDATVENGCLHYLAGSHRDGLLAHESIPGTPHLVPVLPEDAEWTPVPVKAGSMVAHHGLAVHFSPENKSDRWRRSFACHYVQADATLPKKDASTLLRVQG